MSISEYQHFKPYLALEVESVTTKSQKNKQNYICPFCGSGSGDQKTGAFTIFKDKNGDDAFKCHACLKSGDTIDFYKEYHNITEQEARLALSSKYGIYEPDYKAPVQKPLKKEIKQLQDLTSFILTAKENLKNPEFEEVLEYLHNRGLKDDILDRFNIGACGDKELKELQKQGVKVFINYDKKCVIIPRSKYSCLSRCIDKDCNNSKTHIQPPELFNLAAFKEKTNFVYVVEGEIDALSLISEDMPTVGLCSTGNYRKLIDYLTANPTNKTIYLALDNDTAGNNATEELKKALESLNLRFKVVEIPKPYKDPNELYIGNRELFKNVFSQVDEVEQLKALATGNRLDLFLKAIEQKKERIPTGIKELDRILNGGLTGGELLTMGAMPGMGKSAFLNQVADNISKNGYPVIYFSFEMNEEENIARSLSRLSFIKGGRKLAKSQAEIQNGFSKFTSEEIKNMLACLDDYKTIAQNLYIIPPVSFLLEDMIKTILEYKRILGVSPVVIVDYLQLLDCSPDLKLNGDTKAKTDYIVKSLKNIAQKEDLAVVLISSVNRSSYTTWGFMQLTHLKESGILEFSSNIVLGLNYTAVKSPQKGKDFETTLANCRKANPREITINIVKNRSGESGGEIAFNYLSKFNYFQEIDLSREAFNNR